MEEDAQIGSQVLALATLTSGVLVSLSEDKFIRFWTRDLKLMFERKMSNGTVGVNVLAALPGNQFAVGSTDKKVNVWTSTLRHLRTMKTLHAGAKYFCALLCLNKGCYLSGSAEKNIVVWSMESGEHVNTLIGHAGGVLSLAELPEEKLASGSTDCTIKIWKYLTGKR
jgi:WD40 repeat protein